MLAVTFVWPKASHGDCPSRSPDPGILCTRVLVPCRGKDGQAIKSPGMPPYGQTSVCSGNLMFPISVAGLAFFYNSQDELPSNFGDRISFSSYLVFDASSNSITLRESDGRILIFLPATSDPGSGSSSVSGGGIGSGSDNKSSEEWKHPEWSRGVVQFFTRSENGGFILHAPDLSQTTYDVSSGYMMLPSKIRDSNGLTTTLSYTQGLLSQIVSPSGQKWDFVYQEKRLSTLSDPDGLKYVFKYLGTALSEITVDGWGKHTFSYIKSTQPKHRSLLRSYGFGNSSSGNWYRFSYYDQGVLHHVQSMSGASTRITYSPAGDTVLIEGESLISGAWVRGSYSTESYSPHGSMVALLRERRIGNSKTQGDLGIIAASYKWDQLGRLLEVKDPVTTTTYSLGTSIFPLTVKYAYGASLAIERQSKWPFFQTLVKERGPTGTHTTTRIAYNSENRPTSIKRYAGEEETMLTHSQSFDYDPSGLRMVRVSTSSTDKFVYDDSYPWRPIAYWGPSGSAQIQYDQFGEPTTNTTAMGVATRSYVYGYHQGAKVYSETTEGPLGSTRTEVEGVNPGEGYSRQVTRQVTMKDSGLTASSSTTVILRPSNNQVKAVSKGRMVAGGSTYRFSKVTNDSYESTSSDRTRYYSTYSEPQEDS